MIAQISTESIRIEWLSSHIFLDCLIFKNIQNYCLISFFCKALFYEDICVILKVEENPKGGFSKSNSDLSCAAACLSQVFVVSLFVFIRRQDCVRKFHKSIFLPS